MFMFQLDYTLVVAKGNTVKSKKEKRGSVVTRPAVPYWEDPVYHYLSRRHRSAVATGDGSEVVRFDGFMQELVNRTMPDEVYWQLDAEGKAEREKQQQERKKRRKQSPPRPSEIESSPSVNVADLKKRIFNPRVSRQNVIKALEALPPRERKATITRLPPSLRRKLGQYLKGERQ